MLTEKRYEIILDLLDENEVIKLSTIAGATNSSESTIRRDLIFLENKGLLKRVHGGAKSLSNKINKSKLEDKSFKNIQEKKIIGELSCTLIEDEDYIYIDGSKTTYEMIPYLKGRRIFVVTNGIKHIERLIENKIPCYMLGGKIDIKKRQTYGASSLEEMKKFNFDKVFIEAGGIHINKGFTTDSLEEAEIKREAVLLSEDTFILGDNSKFNVSSKVKFLDLQKAVIVTDSKAEITGFEEITIIKSGA